MESLKEREDGWEGDPIINLLFSGQGKERRVWIKTDRGKYVEPSGDIRVAFSTLVGCLPLYDPDTKAIFIGEETEFANLPEHDRILVNKVARAYLFSNS